MTAVADGPTMLAVARKPPRDRFTELEQQLSTQIGTVAQQIGMVNERVDRVEARIDALSTEMRQQFERVDQRFEQVERRIEQQFEQTRRHFDVVAEGLMSKIELVAEGVVKVEGGLGGPPRDSPQEGLRRQSRRSNGGCFASASWGSPKDS